MNKRFTLKPLKPIHSNLGTYTLLSFLLGFTLWISPSFSLQALNYSDQELEELWNQVENDSIPINQRLQSWMKYADATSVYCNKYGTPNSTKKRSLLYQIKEATEQDPQLKITYQYLVGEYYWKTGQSKLGRNAFETMEAQVDSLWPTYPNKRMIYHYLGILTGDLSEPYLATDYLLKCIQECKKVGDQHLLGLAYWNIAIQYGNSEEYQKEKTYLEKAKVLAEKLNYTFLKANILYTKSVNQHDQGNYEIADSLYQETINLCKEKDLEYVLHLTLLNYGNLMLFNDNYKRAYTYFDRCDAYFQEIENQYLISATNMQFAYYFLLKDRWEEMRDILKENVVLQEKLGLENEHAQTNNLLHLYYEKIGNSSLALTHYKKYHKLHLRSDKTESVRKMNHLELRHQHQAVLDRQKVIQNGLVVVLSLVLLSLLLALTAYFINQKANQRIQEQKKQLKQLNIAKDRILSIIAHDLKKPMISFRGIGQKVNYLLQKKDYKRLIALGNDLDKEVNELNVLVDNLLKWAMVQKNILPHVPEEVLLSPIVDQVFDLFKKSASQKSVTLAKQIPATHKAVVDSNILSSILRNLVDNALKFSNPNDTIYIESKMIEDTIHIIVKDTGIGIAPEQLNELFLLKKEKSTVGTYGEMGAGLGLHLVKELIALCKGKIEVMSQFGKGTSFLIYLPAKI